MPSVLFILDAGNQSCKEIFRKYNNSIVCTYLEVEVSTDVVTELS